MAPRERDVRVADGRILRVLEDGASEGHPVFYLHGTPGSRMLYDKQVRDASRVGLRLIGHDRPGYGRSTPRPGRRVVDEASDVLAIADALGLERFAVYGLSGGGPHALACGTLPPRRVVAIAAAASPAPYESLGLDWFQGQEKENIAEFSAAIAGRSQLERFLEPQRAAFLAATPEDIAAVFGSLMSPVDSKAFTHELASYFVRSEREGMREGVSGWRDDDLAFVQSWGFELREIKTPTQIWHGAYAQFVPFAHGQWLSTRIPGAEGHLVPDEGHISLVNRYPTIHAWLAPHF